MKRVNLIPLAGAGERFAREQYKDPKPLIEVSGKPMIIQAGRALPEADEWMFVCLKQHCIKYQIDQIIGQYYPDSKIFQIDHLTEGQASTCYLAAKLLAPDEHLCIGACDNTMLWNNGQYQDLINTGHVDAVIWTFRHNPVVDRNPEMYGWVKVDEMGRVSRVSCKTPLSQKPSQDHAVIGTFYFHRAGDFQAAYASMVAKDRRINGEFYVDHLMNELVEMGKDVRVFEVDQYVSWGTPIDLKTYQYWESFFSFQC
ncbi:MAG: nucleotidyltransferase [Candidatus Omnitrophica bacterium]|nr:nucleotidyltransferase [Candidatus Omnitrophota bacterium]